MIVQELTVSRPPWYPRSAGWCTGLSALCLATLVFGAIDGDITSVLILLAAPALLAATLLIWRGIRADPGATTAIFCATTILLDVTFRYREYADKSVDTQVLIKIVSWLVIGTIALRNIAHTWPTLLTPVYFSWSVFYAWLLLTTTWAYSPLFSVVSVGSLIIFHLFSLHIAVRFTETSIVNVVVSTVVVVCLLSIVVYLLFPTIGRGVEFIENVKVASSRMRGITGSPNALGAQAGFGLCLVSLYWRELSTRGLIWPVVAATLCLVSVMLSQNRSALMALAPLLFVFYGLRPRNLPWTMLLVVSVAFAVSAVALLAPDPLALLSRSGNGSEITTATNRGVIWVRVLELWTEEPLFGYGYGSMLFYLPNSPGLFKAASHAHNIFLEGLVASGLVGLLLFLTAVGVTFVAAVRSRAMRPMYLIVFILIRGLTEAMPFNGVASFTILALSLCTALIAVASRAPRPRPPVPAIRAARIERPAPGSPLVTAVAAAGPASADATLELS